MSGVHDKVILITGASSGIGAATARVLASQGARVVLGARRALDVTSLTDVQAFTRFALATYGRLDVVINNAGVMPLSNWRNCRSRNGTA